MGEQEICEWGLLRDEFKECNRKLRWCHRVWAYRREER